MKYDQYATLPISNVAPTHVVRAGESVELTPSSSALLVMQDFSVHPPASLPDRVNLEQAMSLFKMLQVRFLLVENGSGDFQGVLNAADVLGPDMMAQIHARHLLPREMQVRDMMVPYYRLLSIPYSQAQRAKIGDVLHTMEVAGQSLLFVCNDNPSAGNYLRGVFCAREMGDALGNRWAQDLRAHSFSELRSTLLGYAQVS